MAERSSTETPAYPTARCCDPGGTAAVVSTQFRTNPLKLPPIYAGYRCSELSVHQHVYVVSLTTYSPPDAITNQLSASLFLETGDFSDRRAPALPVDILLVLR